MSDPMNTETVSVTVPLEPAMLQATADYFGDLAVNVEYYRNLKNTTEGHTHPLDYPGSISGPDANTPIADPAPPPIPPLAQPQPEQAAPVAVSTPAPPPVAAPAANPQTAAVPGVEVDSAGLPWDARIHTGGEKRIQVKNGKWKYKRGVDKTIIPGIEAELKTLMAATPPAPVPPTSHTNDPAHPPGPASVAPVAPQPAADPAPPMPPVAPVAAAPVAPVAPVPPVPPVEPATSMSFPEFISRFTAAGVSAEARDAVLTEMGIEDITHLGNRPDLCLSVAQRLGFA